MCMQTCCSNCRYLLIVRIIKGIKKSGHNHCPSMRVRCTFPHWSGQLATLAFTEGATSSPDAVRAADGPLFSGLGSSRPGSELPSLGTRLRRAGVNKPGLLPRRGSASNVGEIRRKDEVAVGAVDAPREAELYVYRTISCPRCS